MRETKYFSPKCLDNTRLQTVTSELQAEVDNSIGKMGNSDSKHR
jgi:hypothetical protein